MKRILFALMIISGATESNSQSQFILLQNNLVSGFHDLESSFSKVEIIANKGIEDFDSISVHATPFVLRNGDSQILLVETKTIAVRGAWFELDLDGQNYKIEVGDLEPDFHSFEIHVPELQKDYNNTKLTAGCASGEKTITGIKLKKTQGWTFYMIQHSHTDIGYTRPQKEILAEHLRYIDFALDYCDMTDHYPDDAKFRWTCQVTWPVVKYVKTRTPDQINRLKQR